MFRGLRSVQSVLREFIELVAFLESMNLESISTILPSKPIFIRVINNLKELAVEACPDEETFSNHKEAVDHVVKKQLKRLIESEGIKVARGVISHHSLEATKNRTTMEPRSLEIETNTFMCLISAWEQGIWPS
ncbi:hypothetical protein VNO77_37648 [Canavalia gladiata]|uniref:Uncharacterized protein n=1 Tax=Canavalia gladiata TaxID=3824 RepID=A0AAN9KA94_CANGL